MAVLQRGGKKPVPAWTLRYWLLTNVIPVCVSYVLFNLRSQGRDLYPVICLYVLAATPLCALVTLRAWKRSDLAPRSCANRMGLPTDLRAFLFFELVRLRRIYYAPWVGCFVVICVAPLGKELGGAAIVGPSCGLLMLALAMPALAPDPAYPFLRAATRSRVLLIGWMTSAAYGVAMLLPAALLAALWSPLAMARTQLLLASTTLPALGLSVRVPVSFGHANWLIPFHSRPRAELHSRDGRGPSRTQRRSPRLCDGGRCAGPALHPESAAS